MDAAGNVMRPRHATPSIPLVTAGCGLDVGDRPIQLPVLRIAGNPRSLGLSVRYPCLQGAHVAAAHATPDGLESELRWIQEARVAWDGDVPRVGIFFFEKRARLIAWALGALVAGSVAAAGVYALDVLSVRSHMTSRQAR